jgi:hypothetical protein
MRLHLTTGFFTALCLLINLSLSGQAEGVSIKPSAAPPDPSALLDIETPSKGLLIPRVILTGTASGGPVSNPATGLVVFHTGSTNIPSGFYYWEGGWKRLADGPELWKASPSNTYSIFYNGGNVAVNKTVTTAGAGLILNEQNGGAGATETLRFSNTTYTSAARFDYHGWNNALHLTCNRFEVDGDLWATKYLTISDSTLKTNIITLDGALTKVMAITPVSFRFKSGLAVNPESCSDSGNNRKTPIDETATHMGFLAQNVEDVFPDLVEVVNGKKTLNYIEMIAPLLKAIQEQQVLIQDLQTRITDLETR